MTLLKEERDAIVSYRLEKGRQALQEAIAVADLGFWNLTANRLYYAAYYASVALLIKRGIETSTHKGAIGMISLKFVKNGELSVEDSKLLSRLFSMRQTGDYEDLFDWTENDVKPLIQKVNDYIYRVEILIADSTQP